MTHPHLSHPDLEHLAAALAARPGVRALVRDGDVTPRRAAVAVVLRVRPGGGSADAEDACGTLDLLLIKRADYEGDPWSGHVALPGGRHEPADATLEETAVRETSEELTLDLARDGVLLGTLDEIYPRTPSLPPILIRPYVFAVEGEVTLQPSHEVAAAFWMPVARLRDPSCADDATVVVRGEERRVASFRHGEHVIWGLTERILRQLVGLLGA
ncbi:MAG TPA: CoA pyrophosphatase [Gemmatimonadaceae bacterium]|nr:CoA pyrophosphatase [Gemmatimonadaceae bacterium]